MTLLKELGSKYPKNRTATSRKRRTALYLCDCGAKTEATIESVKSGNTKRCGCHRGELHGMSRSLDPEISRLYRIWMAMKQRCGNKNNTKYDRYGGRGITVCKEWKDSFAAFKKWATVNGYSNELTIDRVNNDGNYEPTNCRWATYSEQNLNQSKKLGRSGYKGVVQHQKKWMAQYCRKGASKYLGTYDTPEEASVAYNNYCITVGDIGIKGE